MSRWLLVLPCLTGLALAQNTPPVDGSRVRGTIRDHNGVQFEARDALVFRDRFVQMLVISDQPFDLADMWADQRLDHADLLRHHASGAQLVRVGLAGFHSFPTLLTWWRGAKLPPILVDSATLESALRLDDGAAVRLRGTLELTLAQPGSGTGPQLSLAFDVLSAGAYLSSGQWLPPDGGAPGATLKALLAPSAHRPDHSWIQLLHPDFRQRFAAANGLSETDPAALANLLQRWLPALADAGLRGEQRLDEAHFDLSTADGRHWTARLQPATPKSADWQLIDLRRVRALPTHDALVSRVDTLTRVRQSTSESQLQRSGELWLALSPLVLLSLWLVWRFWRFRRLTRHLEQHGVVVDADVLDLERARWEQNGCVMVRLVLGWTDSHSEQRLQVRTRALALPKLPRGGSKEAQFEQWRELTRKPGLTVRLRVDPDQPTRQFDLNGRTAIEQLLGGGV